AITGAGVCAGTRIPNIVSDSWSGKPASAKVGTSGSAGERFGVVTASPRSHPSLTCGTAGVSAVKAMNVWPARVAWMAGPEPLNGTGTMSRFCDCLNSSPERCDVVPVPACAKLYLPGFALRNAINSGTLSAGIDGWVTSTLGDTAAKVTGAKSLYGS